MLSIHECYNVKFVFSFERCRLTLTWLPVNSALTSADEKDTEAAALGQLLWERTGQYLCSVSAHVRRKLDLLSPFRKRHFFVLAQLHTFPFPFTQFCCFLVVSWFVCRVLYLNCLWAAFLSYAHMLGGVLVTVNCPCCFLLIIDQCSISTPDLQL